LKKEIPLVIKRLKKHVKGYPVPVVTEISHEGNPFKVLISCLLSLRTRDETTAKASERLFAVCEDPYNMAKLTIPRIRNLIYPVGFYKTKAMRIKGICLELIRKYDGEVPNNLDELLKLNGVGRKTANLVLTLGYMDPTGLCIDTHCHRIPNRLGWINTKNPHDTEMALRKIVPKKYFLSFNDIFVAFGQHLCKPISPRCGRCPVFKYCKWPKKDDVRH